LSCKTRSVFSWSADPACSSYPPDGEHDPPASTGVASTDIAVGEREKLVRLAEGVRDPMLDDE
jgi:hypothetical protein